MHLMTQNEVFVLETNKKKTFVTILIILLSYESTQSLKSCTFDRGPPKSLLGLVDKSFFHLNYELIKEKVSQLTVDDGFELEGDGKVDDA